MQSRAVSPFQPHRLKTKHIPHEDAVIEIIISGVLGHIIGILPLVHHSPSDHIDENPRYPHLPYHSKVCLPLILHLHHTH